MRIGLTAVAVGLVLTIGQTAFALPSFGANCSTANCHTSGSIGSIAITGNSTTANPAEACTVPDRGTIPVFVVAQGASRALTATLSAVSTGTHYTLVVKNFESNAVHNCGVLAYSDDATWNKRSSTAPVYYTQPLTGTFFTWPGTSTFNFNLVVGASTPADYYDLVFAVGGMNTGGTKLYSEVHFYVQVTAAVPTITLSTASLSPTAAMGTSPANGSFTVSNTGSGTLNYTISDNATWVSESPTSGSTTGPANTITVSYSTASLAMGSYPATITVSDPNASNNPRTISVTLTITRPAPPPVATFVAVLMGQDTDPVHRAASDRDGSGTVDGIDIQPYITALIGP
jgi:hypothetical protein